MKAHLPAFVFQLTLSLSLASMQGAAMEYWQSMDGPWGGDVRCILPHPELDGVVYVGIGAHDAHETFGSGGGVFYSLDGGESWIRSGLQSVDVAGLAVASGRVWVATAEEGVFSAGDMEGPWREENFGLDCLETRSLTVAGTTLLLGTTDGCYRRELSQWVWHQASGAETRSFYAFACSPAMPSLVLAATDSFVYRSEDSGQQWIASGVGMGQPNVRSVIFGTTTRCWAGTFDHWNGEGIIYCSDDSGATWDVSYQLPNSRDAAWCLAVSPDDSNMVMAGTGSLATWRAELYGTFDGGDTWEQLYLSPPSRYGAIRALAFLRHQQGCILAGFESGGGILRSTDNAESWGPSVTGLDASNVFSVMMPEQEIETIIAGKGKATTLSIWSGNDQSWANLDSLCPSAFYRDVAAWPGQPERMLVAGWNDVYLTTDGGETWISQALGDRNTGVDLSPTNPQMVYAGGRNGLFISHDGADTWSPADTTVGGHVSALAVNPLNGSEALVSAEGWLYRTTDAGTTWEQPQELSCLSLAFHPYDPNFVYAGTDGEGVYISTNGGQSFGQVTQGLGDSTVNTVISDPTDPGVVWAGTAHGLYKTVDAGGQWLPDNIGLDNQHVLSLAVDEASQRIFVGSYGGAVRWSYIEHTGVHPDFDPLVRARDLELVVSPVPCRGTATIFLGVPFGLGDPEGQMLSLSLYSIDGRLFRREQRHFSRYMPLDLGETPSGIYYIGASINGLQGSAVISVVR